MKITDLRSEESGDRARVAATVTWEDCDRPPQDLYYETVSEFAQGLSCNPDAFLTACIMPAMRHGEERIAVDGQICTELHNGLITAMSWIRHWYEPRRRVVRIESERRRGALMSVAPKRAGLLFSGGIDSFTSLRMNRLDFPLEHPNSFKDGILILGNEVDKPEEFEHVVNQLSIAAEASNIKLIPVSTNAKALDKDPRFWVDEFQGAVLSSVAHALTDRLTNVTIASTFDIAELHPYSSHPLLDPNYSSLDVRIRHDGITLSRLAKTQLVADWDVSLRYLRVCDQSQHYGPGALNCGSCEKCVRTMLALVVLGKLQQASAFPQDDVSQEAILSGVYVNKTTMPFYKELLAPLAAEGRHDLVRGVEYKIARYRRRVAGEHGGTGGWTGRLRRIDKRYFRGNLRRSKRLIWA